MRIALILDELKIGGGLEHIYQIVNGIRDAEFFVFGKKGNGITKFNDLPNVNIIPYGFNPKLILNYKLDIIHIHHLRPLTLFFLNPFISYKIPILFTVHGLHIHKYEFIKNFLSKPKHILRFYLEKYLFRKVTKIITVSKEDKNFLIDNYKISSNKIEYIPNGIDSSKIENLNLSKQDARELLRLPVNHLIFLTIARFDFQKGYDILVRAVNLLKTYLQNRKVKFVLVGNGKEFKIIKNYVHKKKINDFFIFAGSRQDVPIFLKAADYCSPKATYFSIHHLFIVN
jgi:glycosyltransferase involved in cell wall biosynthesis